MITTKWQKLLNVKIQKLVKKNKERKKRNGKIHVTFDSLSRPRQIVEEGKKIDVFCNKSGNIE